MFKSNTFCVKMLFIGNTIFNLKITEYGRGKPRLCIRHKKSTTTKLIVIVLFQLLTDNCKLLTVI